ncbi:MAG TPA: histidine phosphatase family protein [Burkholderiaceae bacterium]|nr:histidine phosphatase family protein [Burkholderiaceae bacterium]
MGRIYLVRHGQASLLEDDYDRLSPLGETQAREVGMWLGARIAPPQGIVCGTLTRQRQTAAACIEGAGWLPRVAAVDAGFDEHDQDHLIAHAFPEFADRRLLAARLRASDHPRREFHALFERAFGRWLRRETPAGSGPTWAQFRQRCMASLQRVADACGPGQSALVVTSAGPIAAICQALVGLPDDRVPTLHTPLFNASITQLLTRPGQISLSTFNSVAHLEVTRAAPPLLSYR